MLPEFASALRGLAVSENIVHFAALLYLSGFLFRDQLLLRILIVAGDIVYVFYFYFAPETPLWGGIFWSVMFMVVNCWMISQIVMDKVQFDLKPEERKLFRLLGDLTPGEFRQFVRAGRYERAAARKTITREGRPLDKLYFLLDGNITIEKRGRQTFTQSTTFIGEDAFLLGCPTAATVTVEPGCVYFVWSVKSLRQLLLANPQLHAALNGVLNKKLVQKIMKASVLMDTVMPGERP